MLSIYEVLMNANYNLNEGVTPIQESIGKEQLKNAMAQLEDGKELQDDFEEDYSYE